MYDIEKLKKELKNNLSEFRYEHSLLVAEEAKKLAHHYKLDEEKAYVAGLMHDIAKEFSDEENTKWVERYKLPKELLLPEYRNMVHADIGAVVAKELYGLDKEVCNAIKYHTIGHVPMADLDKIVFVADKIARNISSPIIEKERILAYQNIDKAIELCLSSQKDRLEEAGEKMHPTSLKLLQTIISKN